VHVGAALAAAGHALPHAPQCAAEVCVFVSQPFAAFPSQLPYPEVQASPHALAMHVPVAFAPLGQTLPHCPQLAGSADSKVSQPSAIMLLQSA